MADAVNGLNLKGVSRPGGEQEAGPALEAGILGEAEGRIKTDIIPKELQAVSQEEFDNALVVPESRNRAHRVVGGEIGPSPGGEGPVAQSPCNAGAEAQVIDAVVPFQGGGNGPVVEAYLE